LVESINAMTNAKAVASSRHDGIGMDSREERCQFQEQKGPRDEDDTDHSVWPAIGKAIDKAIRDTTILPNRGRA
jgi:hypothetical protein